MSALQKIKDHLTPGTLYRRADLGKWSNAVDRHLGQLQREGTLLKVTAGTYYYPKKTVFGKSVPSDQELIRTFLKDSRFLIISPTMYNTLGLGTTQLYNETFVYNHKRHGCFKLGNRYFQFVMKHHFPLEVTKEFLVVDFVDNIDRLADNKTAALELLKEKVVGMNLQKLSGAVDLYGSMKAKKFFAAIYKESATHEG